MRLTTLRAIYALVFIALTTGTLISQGAPPAPKPKKELSETSKLKAENFKLRIQLIQLQIGQEESKLGGEFSLELSCLNSFDWSTLNCKE